MNIAEDGTLYVGMLASSMVIHSFSTVGEIKFLQSYDNIWNKGLRSMVIEPKNGVVFVGSYWTNEGITALSLLCSVY